MAKNRVGLFGGTFNPIHSGHLKAAKDVQERLDLDEILFIPSYISPHKDSEAVISPVHRLKMIELTVRSYPRFIPSAIEIEAKGKSYSILTLKKIKKLYPEALIFFILGIDAFLEIDTWKDYHQVLEQCYFVVISRPGAHLDDAKHVLNGRYQEKMYKLEESEPVKDELLSSYRIFLLPIDALNITSTEIREKTKKGEAIKSLVADEVEAYIRENRLYQK